MGKAIEQVQVFSPMVREESIRSKTPGSLERCQRASRSLAGGVSSGLRRSVRPYPLYFSRGQGARLQDVDGNSYLDYALGWGPNILGNAHAEVVEAVQAAAQNGLTFGAQHDLEYEVAELLTQAIPCADRVCFANSGTEIVQVALRLARAATGREKFIKFEGHYHGWDDSVLLSYHPSERQLLEQPGSPIHEGQGQLPADNTVIAQWNDEESVRAAFAANLDEISAIICEPLMCNSGCIAPQPGFLEFLRDITEEEGALLIFDEVITGFRLGIGGAQEFYGITPDLATYAKAVGAGTPLSVLAGKLEFMQLIERGDVVHAGTLNGNPLVLSAARAALTALMRDAESTYRNLFRRGEQLRDGIASILRAQDHELHVAGEGPVFHLSFTEHQPRNYRDLLASDRQKYSNFTLALLDEGVLTLPDGRWYLSTAHTDEDIERTLQAVARTLD
ncbi:MAG TPA: aspartate aminotransferase family protein [Acidobacteriaceae bacterium]|nr:aspartate aminotransferase family protein [Acidobacteriaceae bacterium]